MECSPNTISLQLVYRVLHSSEKAMAGVVCDMLNVVDRKLPTVALSLDISAAFDTLDNNPLLHANEIFGFNGNEIFAFNGMTLNWLRSYLSRREQFVAFSGRRCLSVKLSTDVPQGSVLRPLLFYIFITCVGRLISIFGIAS